MSSHEDIAAVYEDSIARQAYIVERKFGKKPFYDNFNDMYEFDMLEPAPSATASKRGEK